MKITTARKQELKKMHYGDLQSTEEFKKYCQDFVYSSCLNMTMEVSYILKKSWEDPDAPFSYDDVPLRQFDVDECIRLCMGDVEGKTKEEETELFKETNEEHNRKIKTVGDYEVFLKSLYDDELQEVATEQHYLSEDDFYQEIEVYQWFIMDDRLLYQLEAYGEVVLNETYWGRQCCGQAIEMDYIIIKIFKEWYLSLEWV